MNTLNLFDSLQAYSLHDREVGYCQGIGFLVGLLLMHVRSNKHRHVSISNDCFSSLFEDARRRSICCVSFNYARLYNA